MKEALIIGGKKIERGTQVNIDLPIANLYTDTALNMPIRVIAGKKAGPVLFVSAALHGDELNGVEIIRRLLRLPAMKKMKGTLLAIPIVNTPAFITRSRYLPDGRDLNRSFPGSGGGSLAARVANCFIQEVVSKSNYGIDLHTGARHRANLPQIRANLSREQTHDMAVAFNAPLMLNSKPTSGTLREYTTANNIPVLLYESGEALRFDETCIRVGLNGVVNVMRLLGMLPPSKRRKPLKAPALAESSHWVRAPQSGVLRTLASLGDHVDKGQVLGLVSDAMGENEVEIKAAKTGLVIGKLNLPLVFEGEAVFHVAITSDAQSAADKWDRLQPEDMPPSLSDEPAIQ